MRVLLRIVSSTALAGLAALHYGWSVGSTYPARSERELARAVAGSKRMPDPRDSRAVAGALTVGALLAAGVGQAHPLGRLARGALTAVFLLRGLAGVTGSTSVALGMPEDEHFEELDRRYYGPLCLGIAAALFLSRRRR